MKRNPVNNQIKLMKEKRSPVLPTKIFTPKKGKGSYKRQKGQLE